jgi:hypothetical protein
MKKRWVSPFIVMIVGAVLAVAGVGGYLAVIMNAGQLNPPPAEISGRHALLWGLRALAGGVGFVTGLVRVVMVLLRPSKVER